MSSNILQVNFRFDVSKGELLRALSPHAPAYAAVNGLRWKIWLVNEEASEAAGIYLFEDETSLDAFLASPLGPKLDQSSESSVKRFDVVEDLSTVTRGPI